MTGPLAGIRVVELGQMIAVPAAGYLLASYGASVIKVEDAVGGDPLRFFGSAKGGISGWFASCNGGKKSIALDLKSDAGRDVLWRLVAQADVFMEGFRAGVIERLGFSHERVRARRPEIIYLSSSGFGPTGPYSDQPVYDPLIQALSGWAGIQQQGGRPTLVRGMVADKITAYTNAQAILAALVGRGRQGVGCHIQASMLEANLEFVWSDVMMDCTLLDEDAEHRPNVLGSYRLYACQDGWIAIAAGADRHWQSMCEALERPDLWAIEAYRTAAGRSARLDEWFTCIAEMVSTWPLASVVGRLRRAEVPAAPVLDPAAVHADPQVRAMGILEERAHPQAGRLRLPRAASAMLGQPLALSPAPGYGEHAWEILDELGYSAEASRALQADGAVIGPSPA